MKYSFNALLKFKDGDEDLIIRVRADSTEVAFTKAKKMIQELYGKLVKGKYKIPLDSIKYSPPKKSPDPIIFDLREISEF